MAQAWGDALAAGGMPAAAAPAGERRGDERAEAQHARDLAWRALSRRDHTVVELRRVLERKRVEPYAIATVLEELLEGGWLDDARYAQRFADDRRRLDGWGPDRIERRLLALGVGAEHVAAALGDRDAEAELEAALALLRRRFPQPPADLRERERALGVLLRKGYDAETAYAALRRHGGRHGEDDLAEAFEPHGDEDLPEALERQGNAEVAKAFEPHDE